MKINEQAQKAKEFAEFWKDKGYEKRITAPQISLIRLIDF